MSIEKRVAVFLKKKGRRKAKLAVRVRRLLKILRVVFFVLVNFILVVYAISALVFAFFAFRDLEPRWWGIIFGIILVISAIRVFASLDFKLGGNISIYCASEIINGGYIYALYLRAFKDDNNRRVSFKEEDLVISIYNKQRISTVAVGLPEEVDAPCGALRVYVNDDSWQEEVKALMDDSICIFVRIANTEPCLWELEQALSLPKELYIIVDNIDDYRIVSAKCPGLPDHTILSNVKHGIYKKKDDGTWECVYQIKDWEYGNNNRPLKFREPIVSQELYDKAVVTCLLKRFPVPQGRIAHKYEKSIQGLFALVRFYNIKHYNAIPVAIRIMDVIEEYYRKGGKKKRVIINITNYLNSFKEFNPLPPELQRRKDELSEIVGFKQSLPPD